MTVASDVRPRHRTRSICLGAIITSACVAAGATLAQSTLPAAPTPTNVALAFFEASFANDGPGAWALLCRPTRLAISDDETYTGELDEQDNAGPPDVDISVGDIHGVAGPDGPAAAVTVTFTSEHGNPEDRELSLELQVVEEDGEFRVCFPGFTES
ncbi:hypothetical protein [Blastococcus sp. CT_GayMR16]|uniref:hypothetical protein n=1 Tax=Blastococcus sp. CT_GayMR16 TaxID=2559607 RepID=UPI0010746BDA|nr:hypothetical protein [Blastococcus sp. CT_GayMR16]TFV87429.1 hypothetical protein E4P38_14125 [Blastococcus sp. CT_GayMR16]